jgi:hypothetical protein
VTASACTMLISVDFAASSCIWKGTVSSLPAYFNGFLERIGPFADGSKYLGLRQVCAPAAICTGLSWPLREDQGPRGNSSARSHERSAPDVWNSTTF